MATLCVITDPSGFERIGIINDDDTITFMKQSFTPQIPDSITLSTTTTEDQSTDADDQQQRQQSRSHSNPSHHDNNILPQYYQSPAKIISNGGNDCTSSTDKKTSPGGVGDCAASMPIAPTLQPASILSSSFNCFAQQKEKGSHRKSLLGIPKEETDSTATITVEDITEVGAIQIHCEDDTNTITPIKKSLEEPPQSPSDTITTSLTGEYSDRSLTYHETLVGAIQIHCEDDTNTITPVKKSLEEPPQSPSDTITTSLTGEYSDRSLTYHETLVGAIQIHCEDDTNTITPVKKSLEEPPQSPSDTITTSLTGEYSDRSLTYQELGATSFSLDSLSSVDLDTTDPHDRSDENTAGTIEKVSHLDDSCEVLNENSSQQALVQQDKEDPFDAAFEIIAAKGLKKGIGYLISCGLLTSYPKHISAFLRFHQSAIDPGILGEYLGEGGITDGKFGDFTQDLIRFNYTKLCGRGGYPPFVGMDIEQALRHFLTGCGFRLPGEAQKIDRIISTFSECYWKVNAGDLQSCPFQSQDTVYLVSFAIIMLNTDLHKSHSGKGRAPKRMTKQEFIKNLRGADAGIDESRDYVYYIYDSIKSTPIAILHRSDPENKHLSRTKVSKRFLSNTKLSMDTFRSVSKV